MGVAESALVLNSSLENSIALENTSYNEDYYDVSGSLTLSGLEFSELDFRLSTLESKILL